MAINMHKRSIHKLSGNLVIGGYLPWHGTPEFDGEWTRWNDLGHDPEKQDIFSAFWPQKGPYSSQDASVLRLQAEEIRKAGIDVVVILWNDCYPMEQQRVEKIMAVFGEAGLKGFIGVDFNWNIKSGLEDQKQDMLQRLDQIIKIYVPQSTELFNDFYYKDPVSGLPVYMIYASVGDIDFWDAKVIEYKSDRATNGIFICGVTDIHMAYSQAFDGIFWTGTPERRSDREGHERHLNILKEENGMFYIGGLVAGFDFLAEGNETHLERDGGYILNVKWSGLINSCGKQGSKVEHVYVPFNDWGEGGSIEPAADMPPLVRGRPRYKTFAPLHATDYLYLNKARAKEFKESR